MPELLFAYGMLLPADPEAAGSGGWTSDAVRGRLYDLGPYPGLVDLDDHTAGWVEGYVRAVEHGELEVRLDSFEGVEEGLYRRVRTTTRGRRDVWIYVYGRPLPPDARGPLPRWDGCGRARPLRISYDCQGDA
jgi:gamma-glutamylcyclotransferase (GGCT)/AIG2-like uncharacterized protein YtfP